MTMMDDDWERRILCSDGNCIGVIGADGRCNECGKPYTGDGDLPRPATDSETITDDEDIEPEDQTAEQAETLLDGTPVDEDQAFDDEWEDRTLCIDESCIGVVGPDGRCKECGKPYPR